MSISKILISYALTFLVFFIIDMAWLGFIAKGLYNKYLGNFLHTEVNWTAAIIFYIIFIIGISVFVIYPAVAKNSLQYAIFYGALFGVFTYATYELTNMATLKDWPIQIVIIDIIWGAVLTAIVSTAGFYIVKWIE
jgi:uncharacterized membrane protein